MRDFILSKLPNRSYVLVLATLALWSLAIIFIFYEALNRPFMGAQFKADVPGKSVEVTVVTTNSPAQRAGIKVGDKYVAIETDNGKPYKMTGLEGIAGRHQLHSYEMTNGYRAATHTVWDLISKGPFTLISASGKRVTVEPEDSRPLSSLPPRIYNALIQSLIVTMIAAGILAFAPRSLPVNLLVLSGFGLSINSMTSMLLGMRELVNPGYSLGPLFFIAGIASLCFIYGLLSLIWYFPSPINRFPLGKAAILVVLFVVGAQNLQFFEFPIHPYQGPYLLAFPLAVTFAIIQWRRSRDKPVERASVMWFMLTIIGVTGFVMLFYSIPIMLKFPPIIGPHVANFALSFIYLGIALGTLKYRLFDMQRMWWRAIIWFVGGLVVLFTDVFLISQFNFEQDTALPLSLLLAGWAYFPVRQLVFEYFIRSKDIKIADHISDLINSFSGVEGDEEFHGRFVAFMRKVFNAKEIGLVGRAKLDRALLEDNGLTLRIPDVSGTGSLLLIGKSGGRQLFSTNDTSVADSFVHLVRNMVDASKHEFEKLQQERQRIVRDLHDDVGGRLLSMIYNAPNKKNASDAREALGALKESLIVIEDTQAVDFSVAWEQISQDAIERIEQAGFEVQCTTKFESERIFSAREYINFKRIVQEIISNAIKYCDGNVVRLSANVTIEGAVELTCRNIIGVQSDENFSGNRGLANIQKRLKEIGGRMNTQISKTTNDGQEFLIEIILPLND